MIYGYLLFWNISSFFKGRAKARQKREKYEKGQNCTSVQCFSDLDVPVGSPKFTGVVITDVTVRRGPHNLFLADEAVCSCRCLYIYWSDSRIPKWLDPPDKFRFDSSSLLLWKCNALVIGASTGIGWTHFELHNNQRQAKLTFVLMFNYTSCCILLSNIFESSTPCSTRFSSSHVVT